MMEDRSTMSEERTDKSNQQERKIAIVLMVVIVIAVITCLVGTIYCCISFAVTSHAMSTEYRMVLRGISSSISLNQTSSDSLESPPEITSDISVDDPDVLSSDKNEMIDSLVKHLENMVAIQKSGMTNDLMSFIYGILSAILVGLCACFVEKSRKNADEATKTANEAKHNADNAKEQAIIAEKKAEYTKIAIEEVKNVTENAETLKFLVRLIIISGRMVHAKAALQELNCVLANRSIVQLKNDIISLLSDEGFKAIIKQKDSDRMEIVSVKMEMASVYDELFFLDEKVDSFKEACQREYTDGILESRKRAVENYHTWINDARRCMDGLLEKSRH